MTDPIPPGIAQTAWTESAEAMRFAARPGTSVAVTCTPGAPHQGSGMGVIFLTGGAQTRIGAHRQFVQLARELAQQGHASLRFDWPGLGDATGAPESFEALHPEVGTAIDTLCRHVPSVQRVVLLGLCDGASVALLSVQAKPDPRVQGLCLVNPWVRSQASLARTQVRHHYLQRLRSPAFWRQVLQGRHGLQALKGLARALTSSARPEPILGFQARMLAGWQGFEGRTLVVVGANDMTGLEFASLCQGAGPWRICAHRPSTEWHTIEHADHTFSAPDTHRNLVLALTRWLAHQAAASVAKP